MKKIFLALLLSVASAAVFAGDAVSESGKADFINYCASCHGALAGLKKKRGMEIVSDKRAHGERIYRLAETSGTAA